jgi:hypothetical protein
MHSKEYTIRAQNSFRGVEVDKINSFFTNEDSSGKLLDYLGAFYNLNIIFYLQGNVICHTAKHLSLGGM